MAFQATPLLTVLKAVLLPLCANHRRQMPKIFLRSTEEVVLFVKSLF
jgi:hypothetical protein